MILGPQMKNMSPQQVVVMKSRWLVGMSYKQAFFMLFIFMEKICFLLKECVYFVIVGWFNHGRRAVE